MLSGYPVMVRVVDKTGAAAWGGVVLTQGASLAQAVLDVVTLGLIAGLLIGARPPEPARDYAYLAPPLSCQVDCIETRVLTAGL